MTPGESVVEREWQPMSTAPRDGWIMARSASGSPLPVIFDEEGWWEDATGDYYVEASHNDGNGLTEWRPLAAGDERPENWMGTNRADEPVWRPPQQGTP